MPRRAPPVRAPLPDIARRVVQPVSIRLECIDGRRREVAVVAGIDVRKASLPDIAAMLAAGFQFVAPRIALVLQTAARGTLPFGFGRQPLAGPARIRGSIAPRDVHDRMLFSIADARIRTFGPAPAGAIDGEPPWRTRG